MKLRGLVFSIDDAYCMPFKVLWHSLIKTDSIPSKTPIFMLHEDALSAKSIEDLKLFSEKYGRSITFLNVQRFVPNDLPLNHHFSRASYFRLYVPSILPSNISSVVYLDSDMVAVSSIRHLFELKMNLPLAAIDHMSPQNAFRMFGEKSGNYFQSGVLVIDLDIWRAENVEQRFAKILREEKNRILWLDQDILNITFEGRWQRLPLWFNVCNHVRKEIDMKVIESNVRLVHLDGGGKPWEFYSFETHAKCWYLAYEDCFGKPFDRKLIIKPLFERILIAIKRIIKFIIKKIQNTGISSAIKRANSWFLYKLKNNRGIQDDIIKRRIFLSDKLSKEFNGVIRYGPFKGFKFTEKSWWAPTDRANMLLGLYEQEVLKSLKTIPKKYKTFIDLGAADGYYGIGVLVGKMFEKSYCYEISLDGQKTIEQNAKLNNVFDDVKIRGIADKEFYKDLQCDEIAQSVLFVDIEGGEFDLFDKNIFEKFSKSIIYIELHDWFFTDGNEKLKKLEEDAKEYFSIEKITTTSRDLSMFEELNEISDTDRWLICSEGRAKLMTWWRLDPL